MYGKLFSVPLDLQVGSLKCVRLHLITVLAFAGLDLKVWFPMLVLFTKLHSFSN